MAIQRSYKAEITLAFDYKATDNSQFSREIIEPERIQYVLIDHSYENVNVLPVIYISVNFKTEMYTKIISTMDASKFYLKIRKRDALSSTSIYKKEVEDIFSYVTASTNQDYNSEINNNSSESFRTMLIGLVSDEMTNKLRHNFNGIYTNISSSDIIDIAMEGLDNKIVADLNHNTRYDTFLVPPITTRYRLLQYLFNQDAYFDSNFTFYMDFNNTYLIPKNANPVKGNDNNPDTVILNIKNYNASEAFTDGFTIENNAYNVYVNSMNTNLVVDNSTTRVATDIVAYYDSYDTAQRFALNMKENNDNSKKTVYIRDYNAASIRNEMQSNGVLLEILKQNLDGEIFTPNKRFNVSNTEDNSKYDGLYFLSYKKDFYRPDIDGEFVLNTNVGLKLTGYEEVACSMTNSYGDDNGYSSYTAKKTYSSSNKPKSVKRSEMNN